MKSGKNRKIQVRLSEDELEKLNKYSEETGISKSDVVRKHINSLESKGDILPS